MSKLENVPAAPERMITDVFIDTNVLLYAVSNSVKEISYWDAAILGAAKTLGATTLYTEDLSHGQVYHGVTVINPFLELVAQATPPV